MHMHSFYVSHQTTLRIQYVVDELKTNEICIEMKKKKVVREKNVSLRIFFKHQDFSLG